jgi:hypothetical protein
MQGFLVVLLFLQFFDSSPKTSPTVAVIVTPGVRHVPSTQRVSRALRHAALDLDVGNQDLPSIVLVCADRRTADVMMLAPNVDLSIDSLTDKNRQVYRVTIVSDTSDKAVAAAMVWFINTHFHRGWSSPRLMKLAAHIRDDLEQTVEASALAEGK